MTYNIFPILEVDLRTVKSLAAVTRNDADMSHLPDLQKLHNPINSEDSANHARL